jgi:hypothetical protein
MPVKERASLDGKAKAELVRKMHEKAKATMIKVGEQNRRFANKGRRPVVFKPGDFVWVHFRKERFPAQRKSKLQSRGDGPFEVLERINDNAYKVDLPGDYGVSATFNVADLSPYDISDLRSNPFQEGEDDEWSPRRAARATTSSQLQGPVTRAKARKIINGFSELVASRIWDDTGEHSEDRAVTLCIVGEQEFSEIS